MFKSLWRYLCWYWRNSDEIESLREKADGRKRHHFKHMYCELHGSMNCDHSTWNSKMYEAECIKIDQWLKEELAKLP